MAGVAYPEKPCDDDGQCRCRERVGGKACDRCMVMRRERERERERETDRQRVREKCQDASFMIHLRHYELHLLCSFTTIIQQV